MKQTVTGNSPLIIFNIWNKENSINTVVLVSYEVPINDGFSVKLDFWRIPSDDGFCVRQLSCHNRATRITENVPYKRTETVLCRLIKFQFYQKSIDDALTLDVPVYIPRPKLLLLEYTIGFRLNSYFVTCIQICVDFRIIINLSYCFRKRILKWATVHPTLQLFPLGKDPNVLKKSVVFGKSQNLRTS